MAATADAAPLPKPRSGSGGARSWIRAQPKWLFEMMHRLTTVELACMGAGTIMWAHSLERLWFELFDTRVTKTLRPLVGKDARGACFLGARRR